MGEIASSKFNFFVYIIESPSDVDLYHGRSEGGRVAETLRLDSIPCFSRTAINREAFLVAIKLGLPEAMKAFPESYPIVHLSAHGSHHGIELSSKEVIAWQVLRELLVPVNQSLNGCLLLCMSACQGYSACQMAMQVGNDPHPYYGMIGSCESPTWSDTAVSYLSFYHLLSKGRSIPESVKGMSAASGIEWHFVTAEESRQSYMDFAKLMNEPQVVQRELEVVAEKEPLSPNAKGLETTTPVKVEPIS